MKLKTESPTLHPYYIPENCDYLIRRVAALSPLPDPTFTDGFVLATEPRSFLPRHVIEERIPHLRHFHIPATNPRSEEVRA